MPGSSTRGEVAHQAKWLPVVFQVPSVKEGEAASLCCCLSRGGVQAECVGGCLDVLKGRTVLSLCVPPFKEPF